MQEQKIYGRREGAVGHLVFNNPAKLNAVSLDMWDAFVGLLKDYEKDPEVRCVVVSWACAARRLASVVVTCFCVWAIPAAVS